MRVAGRYVEVIVVGAILASVSLGEARAADAAENAASGKRGVLVMAHGGSDGWNAEVEKVVAPLEEKFPTELAYGMALRSSLEEATRNLVERGVNEIAVVRLFVSGESFLETTEVIFGHREAPEHAEHGGHGGGGHHMGPAIPLDTPARFVISPDGVSKSPLIDEILLDRVKALSETASNERILVLAHGPGDDAENTRWKKKMGERIQALRELGDFTAIECETLREDWPEKRAKMEERIRAFVKEGNAKGERVIVVPFRVSGFGPYAEVLDGLEYVSDGKGFSPHPNMTRWLEETALACFEEFDAAETD